MKTKLPLGTAASLACTAAAVVVPHQVLRIELKH
jgi:hypothetical protein